MTDYEGFIFPKNKRGKHWDYDTSQRSIIENKVFNTPIGGAAQNIQMKGTYQFDWKSIGKYYFLKLENIYGKREK